MINYKAKADALLWDAYKDEILSKQPFFKEGSDPYELIGEYGADSIYSNEQYEYAVDKLDDYIIELQEEGKHSTI